MKKIVQDGITIEVIGDNKITNLDDLLKTTGYSQEMRNVLWSEVNTWTTSMKLPSGGSKQIENLQIKAKLSPKSSLSREEIMTTLKSALGDSIPVLKGPQEKDGPLMAQIIATDFHFDRIQHKNKNFLKEMQDRQLQLFETLLKHKPVKLVYANLGDYWNSDIKHQTTKGTSQHDLYDDRESFRVGLEAQRNLIHTFSQAIPVDALFISGNHDFFRMQALADALDIIFSKSNNIKIDAEPIARKYRRRGDATMGYRHGDQLKDKQILPTMQMETKLGKHNYGIQGHTHQRIKTERGNLHVDTYPSPAFPSDRERDNGWNGRGGIYGNIIDKKNGKIAEYKK